MAESRVAKHLTAVEFVAAMTGGSSLYAVQVVVRDRNGNLMQQTIDMSKCKGIIWGTTPPPPTAPGNKPFPGKELLKLHFDCEPTPKGGGGSGESGCWWDGAGWNCPIL